MDTSSLAYVLKNLHQIDPQLLEMLSYYYRPEDDESINKQGESQIESARNRSQDKRKSSIVDYIEGKEQDEEEEEEQQMQIDSD